MSLVSRRLLVLAWLGLAIIWSVPGLAAEQKKDAYTMNFLDKFDPRVRVEYRLLRPPHDWSNREAVIKEEIADIGSSARGRGSPIDEGAGVGGGEGNKERGKGATRTTGRRGGSGAGDSKHRNDQGRYWLVAKYDINAPVSVSVKDNDNDDDDDNARKTDHNVGKNDSDNQRKEEAVEERKNIARDKLLRKLSKKGRNKSDNRKPDEVRNGKSKRIKRSRGEDLFDVDFTLRSSHFLIPCWWLTQGETTRTASKHFTVVLVDGDLLEDLGRRDEAIKEKYGDFLFLASQAEAKKTEERMRKRSKNATEGGEEESESLLLRKRGDRDINGRVWNAVEELRHLWSSTPVSRFIQDSSSSTTHRRPRPDLTSSSSKVKDHSDARESTVSDSEGILPSEQTSDETRGRCSLPNIENRISNSVLQPQQTYSYMNISEKLFPGSLPPKILEKHLRSPLSSAWNFYRYTSDLYFAKTGNLDIPWITAASFELSLTSCLSPYRNMKTSSSPFGDESSYIFGKLFEPLKETPQTPLNYVPVDLTLHLRDWLTEVMPWRRRTSKLSIIVFDSPPSSPIPPSRSRTSHQRETRSQEPNHHVTFDNPRSSEATLGILDSLSPLLVVPPKTFKFDNIKTSSSPSAMSSVPLPKTFPLPQPPAGEDEGRTHQELEESSLDCLLQRTPPRLSFSYRLDESCRRRHGIEPCDNDDKDDPECACRIRPYCSHICGLQCDFEEEESCDWKWHTDLTGGANFRRVTGNQLMEEASHLNTGEMTGPDKDTFGSPDGHFLYMGVRKSSTYTNTTRIIKSPWLDESGDQCSLELDFHVWKNHQDTSVIKILIENVNITSIISDVPVNKQNQTTKWKHSSVFIGRFTKQFRLGIEVILGNQKPIHAAIDNIQLIGCVADGVPDGPCPGVECHGKVCIPRDKVCDITRDCPDGEDEIYCDPVPEGARCDFEDDWCGWQNKEDDSLQFLRRQGPTDREKTGPPFDHTFMNNSGWYILSELPHQGRLGDHGVIESPMFDPPPCYHSDLKSPFNSTCKLRLYYHKLGSYQGSMMIKIWENDTSRTGKIHSLEAIHGNKGEHWQRFTKTLPLDIHHRYSIRISNVRGQRFRGDLGFDDFTLSPECFGKGVPPEEIEKCPAVTTTTEPPVTTTTYVPPADGTVWMVTTCKATGRVGPTAEDCRLHYQNMEEPRPTIDSSTSLPGTQTLKITRDGYYTIIAKGASGGASVQNQDMKTHGAIARGTFYFPAKTVLYILVGQEGVSACEQALATDQKNYCLNKEDPPDLSEIMTLDNLEILRKTKKNSYGGGGGGGGASYVFMMKDTKPRPLVVGGGGAGLGWMNTEITPLQDGRGFNASLNDEHGHTFNNNSRIGAGAGGGWRGKTRRIGEGTSLQNGGAGGKPCEINYSWNTNGGFGGGGGGCLAGGGGGGFTGGNAYSGYDRHGEGGYSFADGKYPHVTVGSHTGPGIVFIIPAVQKWHLNAQDKYGLFFPLQKKECGCEYICLLLDERLQERKCLCPDEGEPNEDGSCPLVRPEWKQTTYLIVATFGIFGIIVISALSICCYNRYQRKKFDILRRDIFAGGPEVQLHRLRSASGGMVTEYNPNYEFGGGVCTVKDLKEITRENLTLVKALGQGAFGEVYQGYLKNYAGDSVEMPVAVKTLPEMSSNQAEMDFLMEALIMSKFNHPNIVHFIGVCFDKLPRFIVLELLSGGDLKSFLREARPKPERPSGLTMRDLLTSATDVAKGCEYLEAHHFIHRDIAARNCLLTTKGPGRVVKIADFGMARDIYRNDYYRKGGKAMLPVKWMPPEAFLDGIFTSKTDVWSFGVLLWEVLSLGYMPYPGRGNQEVMQLVTNGGRLEPPTNCPGPVYRIMTQCWHPIPDERPTFSTILERLGYCIQDPDVVSHVLPVFQRPPSAERDATVMRPLDNEACLTVSRRSDEPQSPASTDYLIPLPSSYSLSTVRSELNSTPSLDSGTDCCQMERLLDGAPPPPPPPTWETSFTTPTNPTPTLNHQRSNKPSTPPGAMVVSRTPSHTPSTRMAESQSSQPLLKSSPPGSPRSQDSRERLLRPGERSDTMMPLQAVGGTSRERPRPHHHYHPHRYNNSGSSNNSSSSNSSSSNSSSNSGSGNSSSSTLPLDPATLPCIPPPLQYVNVDVKMRGSEYDHEPYIIHETREHREISC